MVSLPIGCADGARTRGFSTLVSLPLRGAGCKPAVVSGASYEIDAEYSEHDERAVKREECAKGLGPRLRVEVGQHAPHRQHALVRDTPVRPRRELGARGLAMVRARHGPIG